MHSIRTGNSKYVQWDVDSKRLLSFWCGEEERERERERAREREDFFNVDIPLLIPPNDTEMILAGDFNFKAPRFLYIGQAFRYCPENAFYIFNQQIYFII